jgi:ankyrin repeat protein
LAAARGNLPIVSALLAAGADANALSKFGVTPLVVACDAPNDAVALLDAMLADAQSPPDVDLRTPDDDDTPLHTAARGARIDVVARLLTAGANVRDPVLIVFEPIL